MTDDNNAAISIGHFASRCNNTRSMDVDLTALGMTAAMDFKTHCALPRMSTAFVMAEIEQLAERTGIVRADQAEWIVDLIVASEESGVPVRRATVTHDFRLPDTLTELGMTDPQSAVSAILLCAPWARDHMIERHATLVLNRPTRLLAIVDDRTCDAAKRVFSDQRIFAPGEEPLLPLRECDAWQCRCMFIGNRPADQTLS